MERAAMNEKRDFELKSKALADRIAASRTKPAPPRTLLETAVAFGPPCCGGTAGDLGAARASGIDFSE